MVGEKSEILYCSFFTEISSGHHQFVFFTICFLFFFYFLYDIKYHFKLKINKEQRTLKNLKTDVHRIPYIKSYIKNVNFNVFFYFNYFIKY